MSPDESTLSRPLLVPGIGVGGYRSLRDLQTLGPCATVTNLPPISGPTPLHIRSQNPRGCSGRGKISATSPSRVNPDKVKIARIAVSMWPTDDLPLNVKAQVERLVQFIRTANWFEHTIAD